MTRPVFGKFYKRVSIRILTRAVEDLTQARLPYRRSSQRRNGLQTGLVGQQTLGLDRLTMIPKKSRNCQHFCGNPCIVIDEVNGEKALTRVVVMGGIRVLVNHSLSVNHVDVGEERREKELVNNQ